MDTLYKVAIFISEISQLMYFLIKQEINCSDTDNLLII